MPYRNQSISAGRIDEAPMVGRQQVAAFGLGDEAGEVAPGLGKDVADAVQEPVDLGRAAEEDAAQHEGEAALRMVLGVGERERRSPRAAEDDPALDAQVLAQALDVGHEVGRGVGLEAAQRRRAAGAALVVDHDAVVRRVEELAVHRARTRAGAAVQEDDRHAVGIAAFFPVHAVPAVEVEEAVAARLDGGEERQGFAVPSVGFWRHGRQFTRARSRPADLAAHRLCGRMKTDTLCRNAASTEVAGVLYQLYDWQRAAMEPWRALAQVANEFYGHPGSPMSYLPGSRNVAAAFDLMGRLTRRYERPAFGIGRVRVGRREYAITEAVELEQPFCRLLHFVKQDAPPQPRVLVFAPLSGHFATLLRDTVRTLLPDHDVWITDWIDAKEVPLSAGPFHFDDYVDYVRDFVRFVGPGAHAISVCQPTVPVLAGVSLMAAAGEAVPRSLTMMGGPIDTRTQPHGGERLRQASADVVVRVEGGAARADALPGLHAPRLPGVPAVRRLRLDESGPALRLARAVLPARHRGRRESAEAHRRFYDEYNAVMDLPAEYYLETVERVFHKHLLARGLLEVRGERVRPETISDSALFTIEGEIDDISGPGQTQAAHGLCKGIPAKAKAHYLAPGVGHYGIFSGRKYRETIYPKIRDFIACQTS